jgi:hypothetical protein
MTSERTMTPEQRVEDAARAICCARHRCEDCLGNGEGECFDLDLWLPEATAALAPSEKVIAELEARIARLTTELANIVSRFDARERDWILSGDDSKALHHARAALNEDKP